MSTLIAIMGESGHGKTTSMRTLDPATTYYIDADGKGLSWRGWMAQYGEPQKNYCRTSDPAKIKRLLDSIDGKAPHVRTVVIDTANAIMLDDEMARMREKGYDKWVDLAIAVYDLIRVSGSLRSDLTVVWMFHVAHVQDDAGNEFSRFLTSGRKLEKIQLESKFPTVLYARSIDGQYVFETQANNSTAKSPLGLFAERVIPNDMGAVLTALHEYQSGTPAQTQAPVVPQEADSPASETAGDPVQTVVETDDGTPEPEAPAWGDATQFHHTLYEVMWQSGVTEPELVAYIVRKGHKPAGVQVGNLPEEYVKKLVANWDKVTANIEANR